ncbi:MAG: HDOD domain-containing protein [Paraglaciecola sp.]|nr:HDOD domain-containing protein [Paraglaciecola sp.]
MKVIFVDDEKMILNGLKRYFYKTDWDIVYADSGAKALEILTEFKADFIITDMRMPQMNGAQLLERVTELYPATVRIVLSGHADLDLSVQASSVAHQWYSKPCNLEVLKTELLQINEVRNSLSYSTIQKQLGSVKYLPSAPRLFIKINALLRDKTVSMSAISKLIAEQPALTAKVLQLVNSSFFITGSKITKIEDAIIRLGADVICNIVTIAEIYSTTQSGSREYLEEALNRGMQVAKLASAIALAPKQDEAMLIGLLHNIGELVFCQIAPSKIDTYLSKRDIGLDNSELEKELFRIDSIHITSYLLHLWHFPYSIIRSINLQDNTDKLLQEELGCSVALHLAKMVQSGKNIDERLINKFDLADKLENWRSDAEAINETS